MVKGGEGVAGNGCGPLPQVLLMAFKCVCGFYQYNLDCCCNFRVVDWLSRLFFSVCDLFVCIFPWALNSCLLQFAQQCGPARTARCSRDADADADTTQLISAGRFDAATAQLGSERLAPVLPTKLFTVRSDVFKCPKRKTF